MEGLYRCPNALYHSGLLRRWQRQSAALLPLQAINKTIEAISRCQNRNLLVMATGTGKTYTAFQIIWRLWKAKQKKRILFLADRNILIDQTRINDFQPFGTAMTKITGRNVDPAYEIQLALYQALTGPEESQKAYKQVNPDFFELIIIDECHRGSAADDSAWREILEYFSSATQIGLTATPKETDTVSNIDYFGEPVYTYLQRTDPMAKTIVFCNDIDHAERMRRALINHNPEQAKKNDKYVMKITGDDEQGKAQLDNFINPKKLTR